MNMVHGSEKEEYYQKIFKLSVDYVNTVRKLCKKNQIMKMHIDKPNVHRLLELTIHTIPLFSHALFISEMVFEGAHQPLKFSVSRSSNPNAHMYATQLILIRDWLSRIAHTFYIIQSSDNKRQQNSWKSIFSLFGGTIANKIDWDAEDLKELKLKCQECLRSSISGCVFNRIKKWYGTGIDCWGDEGKWVANTRHANLNLLISIRREN
ncbi:MAG: hypothetical protein AAGG81_07280 [Chlamydiota bacterium]